MTRDNQKDIVRIAVAGHTNTGKTTLIRTLLKSPVGKIKDEANVTQSASDHKFREFEGLQAIFVDTPGFQSAGELNQLLAIRQKDPTYQLPEDVNEQELLLDQRAFDAVKTTDAVIYVASLEVVPDRSHRQEIKLIKAAQGRIVGLLNKGRAAIKATPEGKVAVDNRIKQWQNVFKEYGIENVIAFDAHWDKPSKIVSIYNAIETILETAKLEIFRTGIARFEQRQHQIKSLVCQKIAECIILCYQTRETAVKESDHSADHRGSREAIAKSIAFESSNQKIAGALAKFFSDTTEIFRIAARKPTLSAEDIEAEHYKVLVDVKSLLSTVGKTTAAGTAGGAGIGAAVGALVAGLLTGGLGAGAGALLGAKIGGIVGGSVGVTGGVAMEINDTHKVVLTDASLYQIENICISAIWAMSHHGFGYRAEIDDKQIRELEEHVEKINGGPFTILPFDDLVKRYEKILKSIDNLDG